MQLLFVCCSRIVLVLLTVREHKLNEQNELDSNFINNKILNTFMLTPSSSTNLITIS